MIGVLVVAVVALDVGLLYCGLLLLGFAFLFWLLIVALRFLFLWVMVAFVWLLVSLFEFWIG